MDYEKQIPESAQSRGGKVRAAILSPEERTEIAKRAALARWAAPKIAEGQSSYRAAVTGVLRIGAAELQCAVLDDEANTRVLTQSGFLTALGRFPTPKSSRDEVLASLPAFLRAKNLEPFISNELVRSSTPMIFEAKWGGGHKGRSLGFRAQLLPDVCWVYHNADMAGSLFPSQKHIATKCTELLRGLTNVAIDALVDEATGWQYLREKDDLQKLLALYVAPELLPWSARFPVDFYKEMFRLWNWQWPPKDPKRGGPLGPRYSAKLTNKLVYDRLPTGVADELRHINPPNEKWQRRSRLHQWLTGEIGQPHLEKQVAIATNIMKICDDKEEFVQKFERAFPGTFEKGKQLSFTKALTQQRDDDIFA
jgi:hypothetical protein